MIIPMYKRAGVNLPLMNVTYFIMLNLICQHLSQNFVKNSYKKQWILFFKEWKKKKNFHIDRNNNPKSLTWNLNYKMKFCSV